MSRIRLDLADNRKCDLVFGDGGWQMVYHDQGTGKLTIESLDALGVFEAELEAISRGYSPSAAYHSISTP